MTHQKFIKHIKLQNFLSYGSEGVDIEMTPLNVLIGPNATGKSNLVEAISVLKAAPTNLKSPMSKGGGIHEWLWKGKDDKPNRMKLEVILDYPDGIMSLRYRLELGVVGQNLKLCDEALENEKPTSEDEEDVYFSLPGR